MPALVVTVRKELGKDNLTPEWGTLRVLPNRHDARTIVLTPGEMVAEWTWDWGKSLRQAQEHAEKEYPDFIWVMTPGGCVPVTLRRIGWNNR